MADDTRIQDDVEIELRSQLAEEGEQVQVHVVNGEATLTGTVDTDDARARAEACAQQVDGVTFVINNVRVAQEGTTGATG